MQCILYPPGTVSKTATWAHKVNEPIKTAELDPLRLRIQRERPYGDAAWTPHAVRRMGLEWTIRDRGRPKRQAAVEKKR